MLALINPEGLFALRIAGIFFLIINLCGARYIIRHWHRLFDRDPEVPGDITPVRETRVELIVIPWIYLTTLLFVILVQLFRP